MKKDIFWNSIGTSAWSFTSLLLLIVVTRINGIEASGIFSFGFALALIMYTIVCYGGRTYQVSDHNNVFTFNSYIALRLLTAVCAVIFAITFIALNSYDIQKSALILTLIGHRIFDAFADAFYGILQKNNRLFIVGKSLFYKSLISFIIFLVLDILTHNLLFAALALPIVSMSFLIFYDIPQSKLIDMVNSSFGIRDTKKLLIQTFLPFTIAVMGFIFANLARYFVDIYHPSYQGYFGIIITPLSMVILLFSFISTPAILQLTHQYNNGQIKELYSTINHIAGLTVGATIVVSILAYFLGPWALRLIFGLNFDAYAVDIVLVIVIGLTISLTTLFTNVAVIARRLKVTSFIFLASNLLLAIICVPLVSQYNIRGAVIAYVIASCIQAVAMFGYYIHITNGYRLSRKP